jgi:hypothetical protein
MKKIKIIISIALLLTLLVCVLFYTRPMTLAQLCSGADITQCESVSGYFFLAPSAEDTRFEIDKDDERFSQIVELFETRKFRRSLVNLLPQGTKTHLTKDGDFKWEVMFEINDVKFPDGSVVSGTLINVSNFFGVLEVRFNGNGDVWSCTTSDKKEWLSDVMSLISYP